MYIDGGVALSFFGVLAIAFGILGYAIKVLLDKVAFLLDYRAYAQNQEAYGAAQYKQNTIDDVEEPDEEESGDSLYTQLIMRGTAGDAEINMLGVKEQVIQ